MDTQRRCDEQADTGQDSVQEVQQRSQEHEQEFQRLVTPVRNAVMATDSSIPPTIGRRSFGAAMYIASAAPGRLEHHDREEAGA